MNRAPREASLDVVYDGLCRFCERSLAAVQRIARRPLLRLHDANDHERIRTKFPMLAGADTGNAMFVVTPRGEVFRGFFAYRRIMWESPRLYPLLPLFYAPGAGLLGPRIYAWVARHRRHFGCSLDGVAQCSVDVRDARLERGGGSSGGASDRAGRATWAKGIAGALGALLLSATIAPVAQNWQREPKDNFPFSYYPMFAAKRSETYHVNYIVGLDAHGKRHTIPHAFAGDGGFNQTRRQMDKLIRTDRAATLCQTIVGELAQEGGPPFRDIATVQVVTGTFRFADYFGGNTAPLEERVQASCPFAPGQWADRNKP
ncbi:MAG TPA: DCC1-like thiol-disulfide oxidoreductase family protein [Gemmatimonadales bacterium]|nr:DCC1-like thiol-disulfide oxidoreductase family protein [Gemmatimonadales bacterium]